ncbi:hypothetical protein NQ318_009555 [Aromia moschata]|uniref:CCHC-type domain-containing protein n=1 Tax=Aromia moschata TaxID=1265417 RepID=A0AAV8Y9W4_9CUCU|nr:hypothetical protein NQ318_009555 [Aromia moschata]
MRQLPGESPLTFIARLQTHEAKMHAVVHKQPLTVAQKQAQIQLTEGMVLNTLLTGLEPKIAHVVRASNPVDMLTAITRVRRELQLNYFEIQKLNRNNNTPVRNSNSSSPAKQCSFCKRLGHLASECRQKRQSPRPPTFGIPQNYSRPSYYPQSPGTSQNFQQQRPNYQNSRPQNFSQNFQQQRPPVITPNPNFNSPRPPAIQPNPNYYKPNNNRKTLRINQNNEIENQEQNQNFYPAENSYEAANDGYYTDNNPVVNPNYYTANTSEYYDNNENYYTGPPTQSDPPYQKNTDSDMAVLQTQFGNMNLDSFNPNLNFPEQRFV